MSLLPGLPDLFFSPRPNSALRSFVFWSFLTKLIDGLFYLLMIEKLLAICCLFCSWFCLSAILRLLMDGNFSIFFERVEVFMTLSFLARLSDVSVISKDLKRDMNLARSDGLFHSLS